MVSLELSFVDKVAREGCVYTRQQQIGFSRRFYGSIGSKKSKEEALLFTFVFVFLQSLSPFSPFPLDPFPPSIRHRATGSVCLGVQSPDPHFTINVFFPYLGKLELEVSCSPLH